MKKSLIIFSLIVLGAACFVWAYSVSFITTSASFTGHTVTFAGPPGTTSGDHATVTDQICAGDTITFTATFGVSTTGAVTSFPRTVGFTVDTVAKPAGAPDVAISPSTTFSHTFTSTSSSFNDTLTLTAPAVLGTYQVRIRATSGTGGPGGITGGSGMFVSFTVSDCTPPCNPVTTILSVPDLCIKLHQSPVNLTATLTDGTNGLSGQTLSFSVDGNPVGTALTDSSGVATLSGYNSSALSIGDHLVQVHFDSPDDCQYTDADGVGNLGVSYVFVGFGQPINADGSSVFKGATIPVKIKITDYNGAPVTDADAYVFFSLESVTVIGDATEAISTSSADVGNHMRYDPLADQYVFNWDITRVENGTWKIWIDLGEEKCGDQHTVLVSIQKAGKGIKR